MESEGGEQVEEREIVDAEKVELFFEEGGGEEEGERLGSRAR